MKFMHKECLVALLFAQAALHADSAMINIDARSTTNLNGHWQIIIDPYDAGFYNYHQVPYEKNGYFANAKPSHKSDRIEYDFTPDNVLDVPGDWNTQRDPLYYYEGAVWYKKDFDYPLKEGKRLFVYFGAANYQCHVYLNGHPLGVHTGGFTPFMYEITELVKQNDNFLIARISNVRHQDAVPTVNTDWWNYGGLTRRVFLVEVPDTYIQDYFIQLTKGSKDHVTGWVQLNGEKKQQDMVIEIPETGLKKKIRSDEKGYAKIEFREGLDLWSPENPRLYDITLSAETDRIRDRIGFRTIETRGHDIFLNGEPVFLRGICIHEEAPLRGGRAFAQEDAGVLLGWARELGCNFIRLAHYPHNEFMVRLADEAGFLVWSEIPVYWTISFENPETFENAKNQLIENITRDKNRACVVLWSIGNETPVHEDRNKFMKRLSEHARALDPTRLITAASNKQSSDGLHYIINDPLIEYLDVIGMNEYIGWYDGLPEKCDRIKWHSEFDKPLIVSEMGGGALFGLHGDSRTRWSEEYQESLYSHQIEMLKQIPFFRGLAPWILMDFRSPRRPLTGIQDGWNRKGVVSNRGEKKKAFYILKQYYDEIQGK